MGHEIVYCVRCATRLAGADFDRGKAFRAGGRIVCADCLPHFVATLTPDEQQNVVSLSSTRMKPVKPTHAPGTQGTSVRLIAQRAADPPAPKSSTGLILAGVGGAAVLGILVVLFATRSTPAPTPEPPVAKPPPTRPSEPPPEDKREDPQIREARAAIQAAREKMKSAPQDLDGQYAAWEEAARKAALTPYFKEATSAFNEIRDKRAALKPPTPPTEPEKKPVEAPVKPPSPDLKAYLVRWDAAATKATERDFEAALAELGRAAAEFADDAVKQDARADAELIRRVRALLAEGEAALSRLSRGQSIALRSRSGERKTLEGVVARAGSGRVELRRGDEILFVESDDVAAASLAAVLDVRSDEDRRAAAVLCLLEGDRESAERLAANGEIAARYWDYAAVAAPKIPRTPARELEARDRFYAAEREFAKPDTLPAAVARYRSLAEDYADTRVVKGEGPRIQKRIQAGKDYVFVAGALKGTGTFALAPAPRTELAWTSKSDFEGAQAVENCVEVEFAALPDTTYRCWALVGGCCAETFMFYLQTTEGTDLHPKTRQKTSIDPGAGLASLVKHSIPGLKKLHEDHKVKGAKTHPKTAARWEWVSIPLPKYSVAGAKKVRIISDQQGFGVGAVVISSTRSAPLAEAELKEEVARIRSSYAAAEPGLVGWWRLDEGSGTAVPNAVEGGPWGAIFAGSPKWAPGKVGGGMKLDKGDEVRIPCSLTFGAVTLSAWVKHDGFAGERQRYITLSEEAAVIRCEGNGVHFYLRKDGDLRQLHVPSSLEAGKWTHVVGTWDGVTQKAYKDGVLIASATPGGSMVHKVTMIQLGADGESMQGVIDEPRIYNRALSEAEVQKLFAEGSAGTISEIGAAPPPPPAKPWKPLFDGATLGCLRNNGSGWKVEDGALMPIPGTNDAGQTREVFTDGEMRIRFEVKDGDRIWFNLRQGAGAGYGVEFKHDIKALEGKPHELIFEAKGDQVTATLDGKPVPVSVHGASKGGPLQFNARGRVVRFLSIDVR